MIDQIDRQLKAWIGTIVDDIEVSFRAPHQTSDKRIVSLYLLDLLPGVPAHNARRLSLQIKLRYLITVSAEDPEDTHRMLGQLVFAAMEHPDFEVDLEPLPIQVWSSFGVVPCPCFKLQLPLRLERPEPQIPRVQKPPEVRQSPVTSIRGLVLGPGQLPLSGVRVELPALQRASVTDGQGRFEFALVPADPSRKRFRVVAKGYARSIDVEHDSSGQEPLVLHFDAAEV